MDIDGVSLPQDNTLKSSEPEFYELWIKDQDQNDPQLLRWLDLEAKQLKDGEEKVQEWGKKMPFENCKVLDIGCQWGATSIAIAKTGATVTGIDVHPPFVEGARVRAKGQGVSAEFAVSPAEQLPFRTASFNSIVCTNVIEHVQDQEQTLREISRVLRPGGMVFLDGPNRLSPKCFLRDPHYQMMGISILPHRLAKYYVTRVRKRPNYHVGVFPVATTIGRLMKRHGIDIVYGSCESSLARDSSDCLKIPGLMQPLVWCSLNTRAMFHFYGRKQ